MSSQDAVCHLELSEDSPATVIGVGRELDRHPDARAALVARFKYGDPYHPNATKINQHRQNAIDALRLIAARQSEYLAAHPEEGYACQVYLLESGASEGSELGAHLRDSRYDIKVALYDLLTSDAFYAKENRGVLVKSPIDLVVGTHVLVVFHADAAG